MSCPRLFCCLTDPCTCRWTVVFSIPLVTPVVCRSSRVELPETTQTTPLSLIPFKGFKVAVMAARPSGLGTGTRGGHAPFLL